MSGSVEYRQILDFYKGKSVLVTGNTGFKGSWLTHILIEAGARVTGYSLQPPTDPSLFKIVGLDKDDRLHQLYADVRNLDALKQAFEEARPEVVFHMAAQPIVRDSYKDPVGTYATNVMGTVNICEAIRNTVKEDGRPCTRSFINVTTDKVYKNNEWEWGYRETDFLDGFDPYSNSKSCSELVTHSYRNAFFTRPDNSDPVVRISTARAGNVIGGGDFSNDRIIPDCIRAVIKAFYEKLNEGAIIVRNQYSTRPYEHVLEPLFAYMMIAKAQYEDASYADYYNVGPDDVDCICTGELATMFCSTWNREGSQDETLTEKDRFPKVKWINKTDPNAPHEANFLKLDCSKLKSVFGWRPRWHINEAISQTVNWTKVWLEGGDVKKEMDREIDLFVSRV